jgi:hypothetical protein
MDHGPTRKSLVSFQRHSSKAAFAALLALAAGTAAFAGENVTYEMEKVTPYEYRGDVRELAKVPLAAPAQKQPYVHPVLKPPRTEKAPPPAGAPKTPSMNVPLSAPLAPMPSTIVNVPGMSFNSLCTDPSGTIACGSGWPPDPNGDVGPNNYIQAVNNAYAIYNKAGSMITSFTEDQLWSGGPSPCNGSSQGDPIVLYDQLADRWILSHFAFATNASSNFYQCIAVSKTNDPVAGGWWLYPLRMDPGGTGKPPVGTINDYTKLGIWSDCLYMAANGFSMPAGSFAGTSYASLSRSDLENGTALTWSLGFISNASDPFTMIPSSLLGSAAGSLPPAGTPNYFVSESQTTFDYEVRKFTAGPNCGAGGTLSTTPAIVSQTIYAQTPTNTNIVSQPGTLSALDMIDDRLMQKVRYRKIGGTESLWVVHNTLTATTGTVVPQWAQIDVTGGASATLVQQQIYTPDMTLHRWMGSLAVDNAGNMALGYSTSSSAQFPSIAYSGRLASDPLNTLPQTEVQLTAGAGSQTVMNGGKPVNRWGDYTAMSVDPSDDCTFWYTNQYYASQANGDLGNWQTRIGSFRFPSCTTASPSVPVVTTTPINGTVSTTATGGGNVIATGGATLLAKGVCWNTTGNPTTTDPHTSDGTGPGIFTSSITGLSSNTTYFVRAYATNSVGTAYGNEVSFMTVTRPSPPTGLTVQ